MVGNRYLLPKYLLKISPKNGQFLLISLFVNGHFTCKSTMKIGILEGVINHLLTASKKSTIYFFIKFAQFKEWMLWYILWSFQNREQSTSLNVIYHSALETKVHILDTSSGKSCLARRHKLKICLTIDFNRNVLHFRGVLDGYTSLWDQNSWLSCIVATDIDQRSQNLRHFDPGMGAQIGGLQVLPVIK